MIAVNSKTVARCKNSTWILSAHASSKMGGEFIRTDQPSHCSSTSRPTARISIPCCARCSPRTMIFSVALKTVGSTGAVQVVVSGDRPVQEIAAETTRYVGIDGRLTDLDSSAPAHLIPLISDRWTSHFRWRGVGECPQAERNKLQSVVERAHAAGRRVRFWATPEEPRLWQELLAAGVDHMNTDRLDALRDFLLRH